MRCCGRGNEQRRREEDASRANCRYLLICDTPPAVLPASLDSQTISFTTHRSKRPTHSFSPMLLPITELASSPARDSRPLATTSARAQWLRTDETHHSKSPSESTPPASGDSGYASPSYPPACASPDPVARPGCPVPRSSRAGCCARPIPIVSVSSVLWCQLLYDSMRAISPPSQASSPAPSSNYH